MLTNYTMPSVPGNGDGVFSVAGATAHGSYQGCQSEWDPSRRMNGAWSVDVDVDTEVERTSGRENRSFWGWWARRVSMAGSVWMVNCVWMG